MRSTQIYCSDCGDRLPADPIEAAEALAAIHAGAAVQCPRCAKVEQLIEELLRKQQRTAAG
jgi:DNA-directed RNA polymerase subunit RPC12/RpoP